MPTRRPEAPGGHVDAPINGARPRLAAVAVSPAAGGELRTPSGDLELRLPAGAVPEPISLRYAPLAQPTHPAPRGSVALLGFALDAFGTGGAAGRRRAAAHAAAVWAAEVTTNEGGAQGAAAGANPRCGDRCGASCAPARPSAFSVQTDVAYAQSTS